MHLAYYAESEFWNPVRKKKMKKKGKKNNKSAAEKNETKQMENRLNAEKRPAWQIEPNYKQYCV